MAFSIIWTLILINKAFYLYFRKPSQLHFWSDVSLSQDIRAPFVFELEIRVMPWQDLPLPPLDLSPLLWVPHLNNLIQLQLYGGSLDWCMTILKKNAWSSYHSYPSQGLWSINSVLLSRYCLGGKTPPPGGTRELILTHSSCVVTRWALECQERLVSCGGLSGDNSEEDRKLPRTLSPNCKVWHAPHPHIR